MNNIGIFDPDGGNNYPNTAKVEMLLGGVGRLMFPDDTLQFAENDSYPETVYSPRLNENELEMFCKENMERYQAYYEQHKEALIEFQPAPPIDRFWES